MIEDTIVDPTYSAFLGDSDLADEVELVKFTPLSLSLEELSKLWSVFFQTPYALSGAYQATVVLIESEAAPPQPALPVRQPAVYVVPFHQPAIEQVQALAGPDQPIVAGGTVAILGRRLRGDPTQVRIGGVVVTPAPPDVSETQITVALPAGLRAGVQAVQVVHPMLMGAPPVPHRGVESNVAAFVLRPTIAVAVRNVTGAGNAPRAADVDVTFSPEVGRSQRVVLLLNEIHPPAGRAPQAYSFAAPARHAPADPEQAAVITIPVSGMAAGTYLVRVQVDGAESPLTMTGGRYAEPAVELT
jgi:hypothetical protein